MPQQTAERQIVIHEDDVGNSHGANEAMVELFLSWPTERISDPQARPDGARLVSLVGWLVPSGPARTEQ